MLWNEHGLAYLKGILGIVEYRHVRKKRSAITFFRRVYGSGIIPSVGRGEQFVYDYRTLGSNFFKENEKFGRYVEFFHALPYRFRHRNIRYPGQNVVKIGQNIIIRFAVMVIQYLHAGVCHRHVGVQTAEIFFFPHQVMLGTF